MKRKSSRPAYEFTVELVTPADLAREAKERADLVKFIADGEANLDAFNTKLRAERDAEVKA